MRNIRVEEFGKDHWLLFTYIEILCIDGTLGVGTINRNRLRCNEREHPHLSSIVKWKDRHSTRLHGYFDNKPNMVVSGHDDWNCLIDIEKAGYVEIIGFTNGFVKMTELGIDIAAQIRRHKATGGQFATFRPS